MASSLVQHPTSQSTSATQSQGHHQNYTQATKKPDSDIGDWYWLIDDKDNLIRICKSISFNSSTINPSNLSGPILPDRTVIQSRCIFDSFEGEDLKKIYRDIHSIIRSGKQKRVAFVWRCDTPSMCNHMYMVISPFPQNKNFILYHSLVLRSYPHNVPFLANIGTPKSMQATPLSVCSFCFRVQTPGSHSNTSVSEYYQQGGSDNVNVSRFVCNACAACFDGFLQQYDKALPVNINSPNGPTCISSFKNPTRTDPLPAPAPTPSGSSTEPPPKEDATSGSQSARSASTNVPPPHSAMKLERDPSKNGNISELMVKPEGRGGSVPSSGANSPKDAPPKDVEMTDSTKSSTPPAIPSSTTVSNVEMADSKDSPRKNKTPAEPPTVEMADSNKSSREPPKPSGLEGLRILFVDDSRLNQCILGRMMKRAGLQISTASNGVEAVNMVKEKHDCGQPFEIILMDCVMPGELDGFGATNKIREFSQVPIIAATGLPKETWEVSYKPAGMNDYMPKPFNMKDVLVLLRKWSPTKSGEN